MRGVDLLRAGRTAGLRVLGPVERGARALAGRPRVPPLWLRRHVGPVGRFASAAREMGELIDRLGVLREGDAVVDLGCGCGAMVEELGRRIGGSGHYLGIDVHEPSIAWCRRRWRHDGRLRFELATVRSAYGAGEGAAGEYRLPVWDGEAGFVLAKSLFTHLLEDAARAYLREIQRVLAPGRRALVTAFLFDGARFAAAPPPAFPHPDPGAPVRWRRAARPEAAVAYSHERFFALVAAAGLEVAAWVPGFFPGGAATPTGQDVLLLAEPGAF